MFALNSREGIELRNDKIIYLSCILYAKFWNSNQTLFIIYSAEGDAYMEEAAGKIEIQIPTIEEVEKELAENPDLANVQARIKDIAFILSDFRLVFHVVSSLLCDMFIMFAFWF